MMLRRALAADAADIRALTRSAYAKWVPVIGREPLPMLANYDEAIRNHRIDLLLVGEGLAGLIETAQKDDHLLIVNVAVAPACQAAAMAGGCCAMPKRSLRPWACGSCASTRTRNSPPMSRSIATPAMRSIAKSLSWAASRCI